MIMSLSNNDFMKVLKKASEKEDIESMDKYLNDTLSTYSPYDLVFGKKGD